MKNQILVPDIAGFRDTAQLAYWSYENRSIVHLMLYSLAPGLVKLSIVVLHGIVYNESKLLYSLYESQFWIGNSRKYVSLVKFCILFLIELVLMTTFWKGLLKMIWHFVLTLLWAQHVRKGTSDFEPLKPIQPTNQLVNFSGSTFSQIVYDELV